MLSPRPGHENLEGQEGLSKPTQVRGRLKSQSHRSTLHPGVSPVACPQRTHGLPPGRVIAMESLRQERPVGGDRRYPLGLHGPPCVGYPEAASGKALPFLASSTFITAKWAHWPRGIPKALGNSIVGRVKGECLTHFV